MSPCSGLVPSPYNPTRIQSWGGGGEEWYPNNLNPNLFSKAPPFNTTIESSSYSLNPVTMAGPMNLGRRIETIVATLANKAN